MGNASSLTKKLKDHLHRDRNISKMLLMVMRLDLPDCWIAAGVLRNSVWDAQFGKTADGIENDVDVIWFDRSRDFKNADTQIRQYLRDQDPSIPWSVKNQARMHVGNGDEPYLSSTDAMRHWPETATAVAARYKQSGELEIAAPYGLDDLYSGVIRPTPRFQQEKLSIFNDRLAQKQWQRKWPALVIEPV